MTLIIAVLFIGAFLVTLCLHEFSKIQTTRKLQQAAVTISREMEQQGLGHWPVSLISDTDQLKRAQRAFYSKKMKLLSADLQKKEYEVLGEHEEVYRIRHGECSCMDFRTRGLPCKHMYFVNMNLN